MVIMKIDDASSSRCEVISNYRFITATEEPDSTSPVFEEASSAIVAARKSNVCSKQMLTTSKQSKATLCSPLGDDGYITDSVSSMAGSSSSSLSSSWTDKGRVCAGTAQGNVTPQTEEVYMCSRSEQTGIDSTKDVNTASGSKTKMQLDLAQDGYKFQENSRADLYKHLGHDTRRRDASLQTSVGISSIEERLGALTTIDEETPGASNDKSRVNAYCGRSRFDMSTGARIQQNAVHSPAVRRYKKRTMENPYFGGDSNYEFMEPEYFRTAHVADVVTGSLPVSPSTTNHQSEEEHCRNGARSLCRGIGSTDSLLSAPSPQISEHGWRDYSSFLEKHFDIPPHNIDPAGRGKFLHSNVADIPDMQTKRQLLRLTSAHSPEERSKSTISGNRVLRVSGSEFSLNRLGQADRPYLYLKSGEQVHDQARFETEFSNNRYSRGLSLSQSRQTHVRSSMPDLRCQDTLLERDSEFLPDSFRGYQFHHHQQNHQQNYEHTQSRDHPHFRMPQQQNLLSSIMDQCTQTRRNYSPCFNVKEYVQSCPPINPPDNVASCCCRNCPETFHRQHLHYSVDSPVCVERPSQSFDTSYYQPYFVTNNMPNDRKADRHSLDLCNIPQLQKQIRATSELCLQASRRHMFASSADIHKLFSGQIKAPKCVSSISGQSWDGLQYNRSSSSSSLQSNINLMSPLTVQEIPKRIIDKRLISTPSDFVMPLSGPAIVNHCCHFPPETTVYKPPLSFSLAEKKDSSFSPTLRHPTEIYPEVKRHHFQRKGSARVDADSEQLLLQRQLSDYSSETELQLIESNAEAVKHSQGMQESGFPKHSAAAKNFLPINTSIENDSKQGSVLRITDIEPVYANGTVLATSTSDISNTSSNSAWLRQPATLAKSFATSYDPYFASGLSKSCGSAYANPYFPSQSSAAASTNHYLPSAICTTIEPSRFQTSNNIDSSSSSNDDSDTMCHGNNFSNTLISYSHLPTQNPVTVATSHSSPSYYHSQYNNINQIAPTKTRFTLANVNPDVIGSNPRFGYPVRQSASCHDFSVPCSNGIYFSPDPFRNTRHSMAGRNHPSAHGCLPGISHRNGYSISGRHSVMENPSLSFETNIVSEDEGDRLSTLV